LGGKREKKMNLNAFDQVYQQVHQWENEARKIESWISQQKVLTTMLCAEIFDL
jgi:hypothetical protein